MAQQHDEDGIEEEDDDDDEIDDDDTISDWNLSKSEYGCLFDSSFIEKSYT